MEKRITLKQIATTFNVSIATVSKALNDSHEISTATKQKIQRYAELNHYKSKSYNKLLNKKPTKTIGVIIPNIMNNFFAKAFVGIESEATKNGYRLISCISNESHQKELDIIELLKNSTLDGLLISLAEETQKIKNFNHIQNTINQGLPVVMFDRVEDSITCDKVIVNDIEGAYQATKYLIQSGCKHIALISIIDNLSVGKLRVQGYKKALTEFNINIKEKLIIKMTQQEDFNTSMKIVLADKTIDGLLCLEETSAVKSLQIVKKMGYKIPEDLSIISFTNGELPKYVSPTITTVSQHGNYIGKTAAKTLINRINKDDNIYNTSVIKTSLIIRESTKNGLS